MEKTSQIRKKKKKNKEKEKKKKKSPSTVKGEKISEKKKDDSLIRARDNWKEKEQQKSYEAGIDPQDRQLNTVPEGQGESRGTIKPGAGNRLQTDDGKDKPNKDTKK